MSGALPRHRNSLARNRTLSLHDARQLVFTKFIDEPIRIATRWRCSVMEEFPPPPRATKHVANATACSDEPIGGRVRSLEPPTGNVWEEHTPQEGPHAVERSFESSNSQPRMQHPSQFRVDGSGCRVVADLADCRGQLVEFGP